MPVTTRTVGRRFVAEWIVAATGCGLLSPLFPAIGPLLLGFLQWLLLRCYMLKSWQWLITTSISTYFAVAVAIPLLYVDSLVVFCLLLLIVAYLRSYLQSLALRPLSTDQYTVWMIYSPAAAICGWMVWLAFVFIRSATGFAPGSFSLIGDTANRFTWQIVFGISGLAAGVIEGVVLRYVLQHSNR